MIAKIFCFICHRGKKEYYFSKESQAFKEGYDRLDDELDFANILKTIHKLKVGVEAIVEVACTNEFKADEEPFVENGGDLKERIIEKMSELYLMRTLIPIDKEGQN